MNEIVEREIGKFVSSFNQWEAFSGTSVLVTGATGLLGKLTVWTLLEANRLGKTEKQIRIIAHGRNKEKLESLFCEFKNDNIDFLISDIREKFDCSDDIDFIVHGAMNTASRSFVETPVETIETAIKGMENILTLAKEKKCKSVVFISSMEVYGFTTEKKKLSEEHQEYINHLTVRSAYPMAKRMAECLCAAYCAEYNVPVKIIRLAQTFGVGVSKDDTRVFAEFAKCAMSGNDIVLKTSGESERMYLYDIDAVCAILTVLLKGDNGAAYNAANKDTYCSIKKMAELVAQKLAGGKIKVKFEQPEASETLQFSPAHKFCLDTDKLEKINWASSTGLEYMYENMIEVWKSVDGGGVPTCAQIVP